MELLQLYFFYILIRMFLDYLENTTFLLTYTTIFSVLMALGVALTRLKIVSWTHAVLLGAVRVILGPLIGFAIINFLNLSGFMAGVLLIQSAMQVLF